MPWEAIWYSPFFLNRNRIRNCVDKGGKASPGSFQTTTAEAVTANCASLLFSTTGLFPARAREFKAQVVGLIKDFPRPPAFRGNMVGHLLEQAFVDERRKTVASRIEPGVPPDLQTDASALAALVHHHFFGRGGFRLFAQRHFLLRFTDARTDYAPFHLPLWCRSYGRDEPPLPRAGCR